MNTLGDMTGSGPDRNNVGSWHDVSWKRVHKNVQSLRFRIFRCSRAGDHKKLRNLQRLLINNVFSSKKHRAKNNEVLNIEDI